MNAADFCRAAFWRDFAPELTIGAPLPTAAAKPTQSLDRLSQRMVREGYFGERDDGLLDITPHLARVIPRLVERGLPPVFVWLFDQPWGCFARLAPILGHVLGATYKLLPDFWAWHVDPQKEEAGWDPHTDRVVACLAPDGSPFSATCWIPITEATPLNGCMYLVPAHLDPFYNRPTERNEGPQTDCVRALPVKPGEYLIWNQAVLHWGGKSSQFADAPRMSMALEFQRGDRALYNLPLLDATPAPDFEARVRLVAKQILQYSHMYKFSEELRAVATTLQTAAVYAN